MKYSLRQIYMIALGLTLSVGLFSWLGARAEHRNAPLDLQGAAARAYLDEQGLTEGLHEALRRTHYGINSNRLASKALQETLAQQAYLKGSNTDLAGNFGFSLAISDTTVVVGAVAEAGIGTGVNGSQTQDELLGRNAGAAYVFVRDGATWTQPASDQRRPLPVFIRHYRE